MHSATSPATVGNREMTPEQGMRLWIDLMETCDELLRAGILASLAPGEDFLTAYRSWHEQKAKEHDAMIFRMANRFQQSIEKAPDAS